MSGVDDNFWPKRIGKDNGIEKGSWDKTTVSNLQQLSDGKKTTKYPTNPWLTIPKNGRSWCARCTL